MNTTDPRLSSGYKALFPGNGFKGARWENESRRFHTQRGRFCVGMSEDVGLDRDPRGRPPLSAPSSKRRVDLSACFRAGDKKPRGSVLPLKEMSAGRESWQHNSGLQVSKARSEAVRPRSFRLLDRFPGKPRGADQTTSLTAHNHHHRRRGLAGSVSTAGRR